MTMKSYVKTAALAVALVAIVAPLVADWTVGAQKTAANSFPRRPAGAGSAPNSVYGGYQAQQSPVQQQQRRTQSQSFSRQTAVARPVQPVYQQQQQQQEEASASYESSASDSQSAEAAAEPPSYGAVAGQPGKDFPNYARVPKTSFSCDGLPYEYGMYADEETSCQAYHVCYNGRKDSFLCGPGTVFNQRILHCDYWYSVDCGKSSQYYSSNAYMGSSQPEPGPAQASESGFRRTSESSVQSTSVNRPQAPVNSYQRAQSSSFERNNVQQQQVQESY